MFHRSTQHLWNLLQARVVLLSEDVVGEELRENLDRIVSGLTYYAPYEKPENDKKVLFPTAPSFYRVSFFDDKEQGKKDKEVAGTSQNAKKKDESSYDLVRKAVAQQLVSFYLLCHLKKVKSSLCLRMVYLQNLHLDIATELVVSYMMYEYKGSRTSFEEIADSQLKFNNFFRDLSAYYKNERFCLLLCTQAILADMGDEDYRFFVSYFEIEFSAKAV